MSSPSLSGGKRRTKRKKTGATLRLFHEPSASVFPSKEELPKLVVVLGIAASVAVTCNYFFSTVSRRPTPFCDTGGEDHLGLSSDTCEPCPEHGVCSRGEFRCIHGYKKIGRRCVEDSEVNETAKKLANWLKHQICEAYAQLICGKTGKVWFQEDEILKVLEEHKWKENFGLKDENFALTKKMAMETLGASLERRTAFDGIEEFKCPEYLAQLHKSLFCSLRQLIYKNVFLVLCVSIMLAGTVMLSMKVRQRQYLTTRAEELYQQICEILEENSTMAKGSNIQSDSWVVYSWLRDHLLLPRERKNTMLWKKVEELVQEDSRIDQYPKLIKGESKVVLEWQVEGSLSAKMRARGSASRTRTSNSNDKHLVQQVQKAPFHEMMN